MLPDHDEPRLPWLSPRVAVGRRAVIKNILTAANVMSNDDQKGDGQDTPSATSASAATIAATIVVMFAILESATSLALPRSRANRSNATPARDRRAAGLDAWREQGDQATDCADEQDNGDGDDRDLHARRRVADSHLIKCGFTFFVQEPLVFGRGTDLRQVLQVPEFPRPTALVSHLDNGSPARGGVPWSSTRRESRGRVGPAERLERRLGALLRTLVAQSLADS